MTERLCTVLLVDDMADLRYLLRLSLELNGSFEVVGEASNGAEGVALASSLKPDVVVLDLAMPVMDGLTAIPQIRRVSPDSQIMVLSGFDSEMVSATAMGLGAEAYLEKSVALIDISSTITELCAAS
jgi:DNA-binding NarL/FixJ family response regulator